MRRTLLAAVALAAASGFGGPTAGAQEVTAVVSPGPGPYRAALESFERALGRKVTVIQLPDKAAVFARAEIVVTFGGEAASLRFPETATVVACLSPALYGREIHRGDFTHISMKPPPRKLLAELKALQPGPKRP